MAEKEVIKLLQKKGWYVSEIRGSHYQFEHLYIKGKITEEYQYEKNYVFISFRT